MARAYSLVSNMLGNIQKNDKIYQDFIPLRRESKVAACKTEILHQNRNIISKQEYYMTAGTSHQNKNIT